MNSRSPKWAGECQKKKSVKPQGRAAPFKKSHVQKNAIFAHSKQTGGLAGTTKRLP